MDADGQPATDSASPRSPALLRIESLTVRDFRGLTACTLALEPALTLLVGRNGSGKSRLLRALALACGSAAADGDDFTVDVDVLPTLDLVLAPPGVESFDGRVRSLFGANVQLVSPEGAERIAWRTTIQRSAEGGGGRAQSRFLTYDVGAASWTMPGNAAAPSREQRGPVTADLVGTGRDLAAELTRPGSAIRRVLSDLGVPDSERDALQADLQSLSARIVDKSAVLAAVRARLDELDQAVAGIGQPVMSPLPARLEELSRTIGIALDSSSGAGALPMRLHGAGARSLASLQVQSVLYERRLGQDGSDFPTHPVSLVEEPEAHLHPQACLDLAGLLQRVPGQVVVSTHSSHLVTAAPTETIRLVRQEVGRTVLRDLHPVDDATSTPKALRLDLNAVEWEKLKRLVERPFGEVLFATAVVIGDGASERAFLPHLLRHAMGPAAAGICVVDPESLDKAHPIVKFADAAAIPCLLFLDADKAGRTAEKALPQSAARVWVSGDPSVTGDLEDVLCMYAAEWCLEQCDALAPTIIGTALERLDKLKGAYGGPLGRAFVQEFPDVSSWPQGFRDLTRTLGSAISTGEDDDG